jgi:hypothetical protein
MKSLICLIMFFLLANSCTNKAYVADADFEQTYIPFIKDQNITKEEVIMRLGEPIWIFEEGRIYTYRLHLDNKGNVKPIVAEKSTADRSFSEYFAYNYKRQYSLVLVFDEKDVLEKHSLVRVVP